MSEHAKLSPSGAYRWMACPGSVEAESGYPDDSNVHSREGTFAHDIAAQVLDSSEDNVQKWIGATDGEFTVDKAMAEHLQLYVDVVEGIQLVEDDGLLLIETKVVLNEDLWGTVDAAVMSRDGKRLHIIDLKYGAGNFVEVVFNSQCMIYALAYMASHPEACHKVETITMHIVQPRRTDSDGHAHRKWKVMEHELREWRDTNLDTAVNAVVFDPRRIPGDHCRFCKARSSCGALKEQAMQAAIAVFPKGDAHEPVQPPAPAAFSNDELGKLLETAGMVEMWISGLRKEAETRAKNGKPIPGFKLVQKTGNRQWIDENAVAIELLFLGIDPFTSVKLVSPAEAERRLGKQKKRVAPLCHKPAGGIALVPLSHKLPALPENAASVFKKGVVK